MTQQNMSKFHQMVANLEDNHIPALRQIQKLAVATQKLTRELCGVACVYTRQLREDDERRAAFYTEAFPNGWQRFHPSKLLLHVLMYFYDVTDTRGAKYRTASAHSVALRGICGNPNASDDDVMQHIEATGIFVGRRDDDDADGSEEELSDQQDDDAHRKAAVPKQFTAPTIFAGERDLVAGDAEGEQANDISGAAEEVPSRPTRKTAQPAVKLKRLSWRHVVGCVLGRPTNVADREAILGRLRRGKAVWVKLVPGELLECELYKGGGKFMDVIIDDFEMAKE